MSVGNDGQEVKSILLALVLLSEVLVNCSSGWSYSYRHTTEGANLYLTRKVQLDCASCLCVAFLFLIPNVPTHRHAADPMWVPSMRIIRQDHSALNTLKFGAIQIEIQQPNSNSQSASHHFQPVEQL